MVFHNVARALTSSLERDAILRAIMQQMERFFQPETWSLLLLDEKQQDLYYVVAVGHAAEELRDFRVPVGQGLAGWVAKHGETLIVPDLGHDSRFSAANDPSSAKAHTAICIPLRSRLRTLGVIQLFNVRLESLTDYTISFLHVLCDYAAIAIENARAMERIQELTITDDCTGLFNVRHLYASLEHEIERSRRFESVFSLIFIDLDRFKCVNDRHGHLIGSRLLAEVGQLIRSQVRSVDTVFRYGGDEFVVLLPETEKEEAASTALRLWRAMRESEFLAPEFLEKISASFGVASYPEDGSSIHAMVGAADATMYMAKNSQRDSVAVAGRGVMPKPA